MNSNPGTGLAAPFSFGSKAATLARLAPLVSGARFCDQLTITVADWRERRNATLAAVLARFAGTRLAVRSSAASEDGWDNSNAGAHLSVIGVAAERPALADAIDSVAASYRDCTPDDEVLIQPMVADVVISGVVLTRDLDTGGPYIVVNYDDLTGRTDTVTGGAASKTIMVYRSGIGAMRSARFSRLIRSVIEIERVTGSDALDIEFCIDAAEEVFILQVRPLAARRHWKVVPAGSVERAIGAIEADLSRRMVPRDGLAGSTTIFGEMPDWNPAEMIGNAPRPLALSLYKTLITDRVWADARAAMGYRAVTEPLLVDFHGRPYIDVRLSFNSFLPADLDAGLAARLVDGQLARFAAHPELHDKVEFEICTTCRDFAVDRHLARLADDGIGRDESQAFLDAVTGVTRRALGAGAGDVRDGFDALLAQTDRINRPRPELAALPATERARRLLDDCRCHGTLPFSMLARHGFIGMALLRSLVARGVLTAEDSDRFMRGIATVATGFVRDMHALATGRLPEAEFLAAYGHLRPGTYDVTSWRYDERPELYLNRQTRAAPAAPEPFAPGPGQLAAIRTLLDEARLALPPEALLSYIARAVAAREKAKFAFTRSISDALAILVGWAESKGLDRDELSYLPIDVILADPPAAALRERIGQEQEAYLITRTLRLPHIICEPADIDVVRMPLGQPTFITGRAVTAPARLIESAATSDIDGAIVLIESADPGFDWIFLHDIAGLITKFGGANSHMAIRSAEFGLPAAIGCGERLFEALAAMSVIELNCAARRIDGH